MSITTAINIFATITLAQLMVTIGLGATLGDFAVVARDRGLMLRAAIANYVCVPAIALALLAAFRADPMVSVGFLLAAVFPGAPYGPPFTALARGNRQMSVGLMVILAASSALVGPALLRLLVPLVASGREIHVSAVKMMIVLALSQFVPLSIGLALRRRWPSAAERLRPPFGKLSACLNILLIGTTIAVSFRTLVETRPAAYVGMLALIIGSGTAGWLLSPAGAPSRKALAINTAVRNVGACIVIATGAFPNSGAVVAAVVYGPVQTIVVALLALAWGRTGWAGNQPTTPGTVSVTSGGAR